MNIALGALSDSFGPPEGTSSDLQAAARNEESSFQTEGVRITPILDPGNDLDLEVARHVFGHASSRDEAAAYSRDEIAAQRLRELLEARGTLRCTFEPWEGTWYCTWWTVAEGAPRERLASGSGPTRALAFCRASVNLPSWVTPLERPRPVLAPPAAPRACESCGSEERMRGRARAVKLCNVCAWKVGKLVQDRRFG